MQIHTVHVVSLRETFDMIDGPYAPDYRLFRRADDIHIRTAQVPDLRVQRSTGDGAGSRQTFNGFAHNKNNSSSP